MPPSSAFITPPLSDASREPIENAASVVVAAVAVVLMLT